MKLLLSIKHIIYLLNRWTVLRLICMNWRFRSSELIQYRVILAKLKLYFFTESAKNSSILLVYELSLLIN